MRRFIVGWKVLGYARRFSAEIVNCADGVGCPACGSRRLGHHSSYGKYLYGSEIEILRVRCHGCGTTHAVLPSCSVPALGSQLSCGWKGTPTAGRRRAGVRATVVLPASFADGRNGCSAAVAQLVEQGTENPCVNSSILFGGIARRGSIALQLRFQAYGPLR